MKRILSFIFILVLSTSMCVPSHADEYELVDIIVEVVESPAVRVSETEVTSIPKEYTIDEKSNETTFAPRYIPNIKKIQFVDAKHSRANLYGFDAFGVKIKVGTHDIDMTVCWYETWECDENGNQMKFISKTKKLIAEATREYHTLPYCEVWESSWDGGVGGTMAIGTGDVKSKLGTHSFTHRAYVN